MTHGMIVRSSQRLPSCWEALGGIGRSRWRAICLVSCHLVKTLQRGPTFPSSPTLATPHYDTTTLPNLPTHTPFTCPPVRPSTRPPVPHARAADRLPGTSVQHRLERPKWDDDGHGHAGGGLSVLVTGKASFIGTRTPQTIHLTPRHGLDPVSVWSTPPLDHDIPPPSP